MSTFFCTYEVFKEVAGEFLELSSLTKNRKALADGMQCLEFHYLHFDGTPSEWELVVFLMKECLRNYIRSAR